ncbi:hypothetical protein JW979_02485 [bacterium]|nr:hypothetical protein [candidate division CSSED10-310 bacterium]
MEVEIHRDRFRQLKEGGWDVLKENKYPKFKPICNKCLSEGKKKISDNYIKKKISTSTEAKNPKKYLKSKKNNCLTSSKKPDKPSLKSSLKKFKFKLSPADKVRIKAKSVLKKYKK